MCGIFGALGLELSPNEFERALRTLDHRGPDGFGADPLPNGRGHFGHTRLAIIDLSDSGRQPMTNEDGTLFLTLNGEIYNHVAIRRELEKKGHTFKSDCDAEVVLHLYEERGIELVHELHGMFAFALYDAKRDKLFMARDRLGIKPLYYHAQGERFAFASELKAIRALRGLDLQPDPTAYYDFLTYQFVPAPKTIYRNTYKLPAAHWLEWSGGEVRVERYWDPFGAPRLEGSEEELLAQLEALLDEVVRDHLVSDVPVGVFLSAGVDSTLIANAAKKSAGDPHRAFTIAFEGRKDDEAVDAAEIAKALGAQHDIGQFGLNELLRNIERMPQTFDEPFADASALPCFQLCELAARHLKVVLSGDGGDETFLGYSRYLKRGKKQRTYGIASAVPGLKQLAGTGFFPNAPWVRAIREEPLGRPYSFHLGIAREAKRTLLDLPKGEFEDYDDYWLVREDADSLDTYEGQQRVDLKSHLPDGILTKVDRTSMRYGLEVRPPLLDHRIVEFAIRLPDDLKIRDKQQKYLLRKLLGRYVPESIAGARKRAFSVPMRHFVREGAVRPKADIDVFGAFRVNLDKLGRHFQPTQDNQLIWMLHTLEAFVHAESGAA